MRKSPAEQIAEARAALQRAQERQRREDTRQKIVVGATAWGWLCGDPQAARRFISHVQAADIREQDKDLLYQAIHELQKTIPTQSGV
jgi:hypothetical protein